MNSEDQEVAISALAIGINLPMDVSPFIVRLLPIQSLKHKLLKEHIDTVMQIMFETNG